MLRCEILDVQGFSPAIHGMRNPKNSWDKSDSFNCKIYGEDCDFCKYNYLQCSNYYIGENDLKLMKALFNAGTEHRKYDRMIQVWMDIEAPLYWWKEFDTYKIGTVANSCSTMHKIAEKEFTVDDFSHEHLNYSFISDDGEEEPVEFEEYYLASQDVLDITIRALNKYRDMYIKTKEQLCRKVTDDYYSHETEINGLFFDFPVEMPKGEILEAYAELMDHINGDEVIYPTSPSLSEVYKGNCKDFLEGFNGAEGYHRYCWGDREEELDFVW